MECSICQEQYSKIPCSNRILPCGHKYHVKCINNWLTKENTCPLCRLNIETYNPIRIKCAISKSHSGVPIMTDATFAATRIFWLG